MAPKGRPAKRAAAPMDGGSSKRCKVVADALKASSSLPDTVLTMLGVSVPGALDNLPEDRSAYQKSFIEMIGVALGGEETILSGKATDADLEVARASQAIAESEAETNRLNEAIAAKNEEIKAQEAKLKGDDAGVKASQAGIKAALKLQASFTSEMDGVRAERELFKGLIGGDFTALRDSPPAQKAAVKKHIGPLTRTLTKYEADEALVLGLPSSLGKKPEERGAFDNMLIDHLGKVLEGHVEKFEGRIAASEQEAASRAAAVGAAQEARDAASAGYGGTQEALETRNAEEKALQAKLTEAEKKGNAQGKEAGKVARSKAAADSSLADLREALAAFASQRDGPPKAQDEAQE